MGSSEDKTLKVLVKMGRLSNAFEGGHGKIYHATYSHPYCHGKALCGTSPGRRSAGWGTPDKANQEVTCTSCKKILSKGLSNE